MKINEEIIKGFKSAYITYNFPAYLDNHDLRKKIGYAEIKGIKSYSCGNCSKFKNNFCVKYAISAKKHACCSGWESRAIL